jgi:hypothetical protein
MLYFESNLFVARLSKEFDHSENNSYLFLRLPKSADMSFQFRTHNRLMDYIWNDIGWIGDSNEFYELLICTMYTLPGLSGALRSRYSEEQLRKKYEKTAKPPKNAQLNKHLLYIIKFFAAFLAMYKTYLKKYDSLKSKSYEKTERKLWKEQEKIRKLEVIEDGKKQLVPVMN